jgi:hypothetical protein
MHNIKDVDEYLAIYKKSVDNPAAFWVSIASQFEWRGAPITEATALAHNFFQSKGPIFVQWFKGSTTNLAFNALDRQVATILTKVEFNLSDHNHIFSGCFRPRGSNCSVL